MYVYTYITNNINIIVFKSITSIYDNYNLKSV
jgi:hypothetical protein